MEKIFKRSISLLIILIMTSNLVIASQVEDIDNINKGEKADDKNIILEEVKAKDPEDLEVSLEVDSKGGRIEGSEYENLDYQDDQFEEKEEFKSDYQSMEVEKTTDDKKAEIKTSDLTAGHELAAKITALINEGKEEINIIVDADYEISSGINLLNKLIRISMIGDGSGRTISLSKRFRNYIFNLSGSGDENLSFNIDGVDFVGNGPSGDNVGILKASKLDFTIENSNISNFKNQANQGATFSLGNSNVVIGDNSSFNNNSNKNSIFSMSDGSKLALEGSSINFEANSGNLAGAIYGNASEINLGGDKTTFMGNRSDNGGAIHLVVGLLNLSGNSMVFRENCTNRGNDFVGDGGAIYLKNSKFIVDQAEDLIFTENLARDGGAIYSDEDIKIRSKNMKFIRNSYRDNASNDSEKIARRRYGGAIYAGGNVKIEDSGDLSFDGNIAGTSGGAIYSKGQVDIRANGILEIKNSSSSKSGGAIDSGGSLNLRAGQINFQTNETSITGKGGSLYSPENIVLEADGDISITKSLAAGGGGIYTDRILTIKSGGRLSLNENQASSSGGVVTSLGGIDIRAKNLEVLGNKAGSKGGLSTRKTIGGSSNIKADINIEIDEDVIFKSNETTGKLSSHHGGALDSGGNVSIKAQNLSFEDNKAHGMGGAVYVQEKLSLHIGGDIVFKNNKSLLNRGGAIYVGPGGDLDGDIGVIDIKSKSLYFYNNHAGRQGGAIYLKGLDMKLDSPNILFKNNSSLKGDHNLHGGGAIIHSLVDSKNDFGGIFINNLAKNDNKIVDEALNEEPNRKIVLKIYADDDQPIDSITINDFDQVLGLMKKLDLAKVRAANEKGGRFNLTGNTSDEKYSLDKSELDELLSYLDKIYDDDLETDIQYIFKDSKNIIKDSNGIADGIGHIFLGDSKVVVPTSFRVNFDANSGSYQDGSTVKPKTIDKGARVEELSEKPRRSGYTFRGWKELGSSNYFDFTTSIGSDLRLYAQWSKDSGGGGGGGHKEKPEPKPEPKPDPKPQPDRDRRGREIGKIIEPKIEFDLNTVDHLAYIKGYEDSTVRPDGNLTREEAAMVFYRLMDKDFREIVKTKSHSFTDVEAGKWSERAIATLSNAEMISGYKDKSFKPAQPITRAELSSMIAKLTDTIVLHTEFQDIAEHWAEDYINTVQNKGWVKGDGDGNFRPDDNISRSEFATVLNSILDRRVKKEDILSDIKTFKDLEKNTWYYEVMIEAINGHKYHRQDGREIWTELDDREFE